jgi:thiamine-phosphate pyrophosphorylase
VVDATVPDATVEAAVAAGVDWVQLRDRELDGAPLLARADALREAVRRGAGTRDPRARILVNRRVDVALAAGADGVHLGYDGMDVASARSLLPPEALVGRATHDEAEIEPQEGLQYVHLAPIYTPLSKAPSRTPIGLDGLAAACRRGVPVLAQGGITREVAGPVCRAGAAGIAVTGAILHADDPGRAARGLREALDG